VTLNGVVWRDSDWMTSRDCLRGLVVRPEEEVTQAKAKGFREKLQPPLRAYGPVGLSIGSPAFWLSVPFHFFLLPSKNSFSRKQYAAQSAFNDPLDTRQHVECKKML
jgi:hypothetical protein